jgi:hypothetical protein
MVDMTYSSNTLEKIRFKSVIIIHAQDDYLIEQQIKVFTKQFEYVHYLSLDDLLSNPTKYSDSLEMADLIVYNNHGNEGKDKGSKGFQRVNVFRSNGKFIKFDNDKTPSFYNTDPQIKFKNLDCSWGKKIDKFTIISKLSDSYDSDDILKTKDIKVTMDIESGTCYNLVENVIIEIRSV